MPLQNLLDALAIEDDSCASLFARAFPRLCASGAVFAGGQPPGWDATALRLLAALNALAAQDGASLEMPRLKEKFGSLRAHMKVGGLPAATRRALLDLMVDAETESAMRCVRCGRRGTVTRTGGWISPRCARHDAVRWPRRSPATAHVRMGVAAAIPPTAAWRPIRTEVGEAFERCAVVIGEHEAALELALLGGQIDVCVRILARADGSPTIAKPDAILKIEETAAEQALAALTAERWR